MLRLALLSARGRLGTFTGAFVALFASAALMMAGAMPFEAALRTHPPVERYDAAAAVVTGHQDVGGEDKVPLGERARVDAGLAARLAERQADALCAERRPRAGPGRRGRHRLPRQARSEAASRVDRGRPHGHRR